MGELLASAVQDKSVVGMPTTRLAWLRRVTQNIAEKTRPTTSTAVNHVLSWLLPARVSRPRMASEVLNSTAWAPTKPGSHTIKCCGMLTLCSLCIMRQQSLSFHMFTTASDAKAICKELGQTARQTRLPHRQEGGGDKAVSKQLQPPAPDLLEHTEYATGVSFSQSWLTGAPWAILCSPYWATK
jgi:hypothetical protein